MNQQMQRLFVAWARQRRIRKPDNEIGMRILQQQFMNEVQMRANAAAAQAQQVAVIGAAGDDTYASDPIARADQPLNLLRNDGGLIDVMDPETEDSDFTELVRDRNRALEEAGGDDLAGHIIYRDEQREKTANEPQTRNPLSAEGAMMGSSAQVTSPVGVSVGSVLQAVAAQATVANWSGKDSNSRMVAVSFQQAPVDPHFGAFAVKPFGICQFGTQGFSAQVEVDIGTGVVFAVPGSQVVLSVGQDPPVGAENPSTLTVAGMLSFDPVSKTPAITRTVYIEGLGAGASTGGIAIKPFARSLWFFRAPFTEPITIEFHNSALALLYSATLAASTNLTDPIPIANDVTNIVITSTGAGGVTHGRLIYNLGL